MIPTDVRDYALAPAANDPQIPEERRHADRRFFIFFGAEPSVTAVMQVRLAGEDVAAAVDDVRKIVAERGHRNVSWSVVTPPDPPDLLDRLLAAGLLRDDRPGAESSVDVMVFADATGPAGPDEPKIVARRIGSFAELLLADRIDREAFGLEDGGEDWLERAPSVWERERGGTGPRVYLAYHAETPVGTARAIFAPWAAMLLGGGVLEPFRGRGVYRALVRARWSDAAERGTPALAVHAGAMSRPILERLGFVSVGTIERFYDPET